MVCVVRKSSLQALLPRIAHRKPKIAWSIIETYRAKFEREAREVADTAGVTIMNFVWHEDGDVSISFPTDEQAIIYRMFE